MKFGNNENNHHQTRTPEITIRSEGNVISKGFVDGKDMAIAGSWRWVKVYKDKKFEKLMTFDITKAARCEIHWFSEKPYWYHDISWGGLTVASE